MVFLNGRILNNERVEQNTYVISDLNYLVKTVAFIRRSIITVEFLWSVCYVDIGVYVVAGLGGTENFTDMT